MTTEEEAKNEREGLSQALRDLCKKPVKLDDGRTLACFLSKGHTTPQKCYAIEFGGVTAHQGDCKSPGKDCQGCWDGAAPPDYKAAIRILEANIDLLEADKASAQVDILSLEEEILACPAVSYHTQKPEDIGACVHPWNKVYEGDSEEHGRVICMACNETLIEPFPEED